MTSSNSHMTKLMILKRGLNINYLKSLATYMCVSVSDVVDQVIERHAGDSGEKCVAMVADETFVDLPTYYVRVEDPTNCSYCALIDAIIDNLGESEKANASLWIDALCTTQAEQQGKDYESVIDMVLRTTKSCIIYLPWGIVQSPNTLVDALKVNAMEGGRVHVLGGLSMIKERV